MSDANGKANKPAIIVKLGVEYWVTLPLEIIEMRIGMREEKWRVYYGIIRCSFSMPLFSPVAIRPRLRVGGFSDWVTRLRKRISESRAIRAGELNDEISAEDEDGKGIPLTQADLCLITGMGKSHVSEAIKELRADGLIGPTFPFYAVAKPSAPLPAVDSDPKVPFKGNSTLCKLNNALGLNLRFKGNSPEDEEWALKVLTKHFEALKARTSEVRKEIRDGLKRDCEGNSILIRGEEPLRSDSSSSSSSSVEDTPPWDEEPTTTTKHDKAKIHEALSQHGHPDEEATEILVKRCRRQAPDCTAAEIVHFIADRASVAPEDPLVAYIQAQRARGAGGGK